jgi:hypothetical protein
MFLTLSSGWGRLVPGRWWADRSRSVVPGCYLFGFVLFTSLFALGAELHVSLPMAVAGTAVFLVIGAVGLLRAAFGDRRTLLPHGLIGLGIAAYWVLGTYFGGNEGAIDPYFYAASPFVVFERDWLTRGLTPLPDAAAVQDLLQLVATTRAGASAVLWPVALFGDGLGVGQVTEAGVGLILVSGLICADLVPRSVDRWVAVVSGLGGIGVYNAIAILSGGQLQQAVAMLIVLAFVWLARGCSGALTASMILMLGSFALSASYPEFLVALPIYVAVVVVVRGQPPTATLAQLAGLIAGFGLELAVSRGASLDYLLNQAIVTPGWQPLPHPPASAIEAAIDVVVQTRPPLILLALMALTSGAFWARWRGDAGSGAVPRNAIGLLALGCLVWIVVLIRTPNLSYAVFKLGGWLGPGLVLMAWGIIDVLRGQKRRLAQTGLVFFALSRAASLVYGGGEVLNVGRPALAPQWPRELTANGGCVVAVDASDRTRIVAGIAGSAAPFHNCSLTDHRP